MSKTLPARRRDISPTTVSGGAHDGFLHAAVPVSRLWVVLNCTLRGEDCFATSFVANSVSSPTQNFCTVDTENSHTCISRTIPFSAVHNSNPTSAPDQKQRPQETQQQQLRTVAARTAGWWFRARKRRLEAVVIACATNMAAHNYSLR